MIIDDRGFLFFVLTNDDEKTVVIVYMDYSLMYQLISISDGTGYVHSATHSRLTICTHVRGKSEGESITSSKDTMIER